MHGNNENSKKKFLLKSKPSADYIETVILIKYKI